MDGSTLTAADWFNDANRYVYTIFADDATRAAARNTLFTGGTVTVSTPVIAATQTWNDAAVTFIGNSNDFTDTASAAASLLTRWRAGAAGTTLVMQLGKSGLLELPLATASTTGIRLGADVDLYRSAADILRTPDSLTVDGQIIVSGVGPHAIGGATSTSMMLHIAGTTSPAGANALGVGIDTTQTVTANGFGTALYISPTLNEAGSGTHADFASVYLDAPTIGAGAAALTNASTLKITGAPTGGTNNYALFIDAGAVRIDDAAANGSVATAMSSVGPVGSNTTIQEWLKVTIGANVRYIPCF